MSIANEDDGVQVATDFRSFDKVTIADADQPKNLHMTPDLLVKQKIYAVFYLKNKFHQVETVKESRPLKVVKKMVKLFQYTQLSQELKTSLEIRQRIVNRILSDRKQKEVLAYLNETGVSTENNVEHLNTLDGILETLYKHGAR